MNEIECYVLQSLELTDLTSVDLREGRKLGVNEIGNAISTLERKKMIEKGGSVWVGQYQRTVWKITDKGRQAILN